ncbi:30S ribosomal protein S9 [Patescibacteria group bacterium]|nr:30S ribosomal protein S9 [Patescibacteria group bacterium]
MPEAKSTKTKTKKSDFIHAVGRRKTANARIRLYQKKGPIIVNDMPIEEYFPLKVYKHDYLEPFQTTNTLEKYSATIKVLGSGKSGQLGAVVHGIARALAKADPKKYRPLLKKRGFLTRDPRMKERRKPGLAQSARAKKQSPKR